MKTNKFYAWMMAATLMVAPIALTSCDNDDDEEEKVKTVIVSFENQALNTDGYWNGDTNGTKSTDEWGGTVYACTYKEGGLTFNTNYNVSDYGSYWMGYAIANRTGKTMADPSTPDQYNTVTGKAHTGSKYCIVQTYGESIDVDVPMGVIIRSLWYTNSAYPVNSFLNGDTYSGGPFEKNDWLKCTVVGTHPDGKTSTVDIDLAKDGDYVKEWKQADLSSLGIVTKLNFVFTGSRTGAYGLNTPAYICIDDVVVEEVKMEY